MILELDSMDSISLVPAGLMLGFDNGSVGGTEQGWKRKKGLLLLPVFCLSGQQEADQYAGIPAAFHSSSRLPLWYNSGCPPASFLITVLQKHALVTTGNSPQRSESSHSGPFL